LLVDDGFSPRVGQVVVVVMTKTDKGVEDASVSGADALWSAVLDGDRQ